MKLTMAEIHDIRNKYFQEGKTISEISRETKRDRKTIRTYIEMDDWNQEAPQKIKQPPTFQKLDEFKLEIDQWLENDKRAKRKQRHSARRVYDRLKEIHGDFFGCSYRTVAAYVKMKKGKIYTREDGFLPLQHKPGEGQVDFGEAEFIENGKLFCGKYLVVTYPYSNQGYIQLFRGENLECLLEGLTQIFTHVGGVNTELWFDNTTTIVTKILKGGERTVTDAFLRFQEHFGFTAKYCNPDEGHEKGNVENKVGYSRRNMLVPIPEFSNLKDFNRELLKSCDKDGVRNHYRQDELITSLFEEDKKALHPLPVIEFDTAKYLTCRTNGYGRFYLNKGLHEYSASPSYANVSINVKITADEVIPLTDSNQPITIHKRLYGDTKQQSMQWLPYLTQLSRRPAALKYTGIYEMMPEPLKNYLDNCLYSERGKILRVIADLTQDSGFESAIETVQSALAYGTIDVDSLVNLHRRIHPNFLEMPPIKLSDSVPNVEKITVDFHLYDKALLKQETIPC